MIREYVEMTALLILADEYGRKREPLAELSALCIVLERMAARARDVAKQHGSDDDDAVGEMAKLQASNMRSLMRDLAGVPPDDKQPAENYWDPFIGSGHPTYCLMCSSTTCPPMGSQKCQKCGSSNTRNATELEIAVVCVEIAKHQAAAKPAITATVIDPQKNVTWVPGAADREGACCGQWTSSPHFLVGDSVVHLACLGIVRDMHHLKDVPPDSDEED